MSDSNTLLLNAHEAMVKAGLNVEAVYQRLGVDPLQWLQPGTRFPHEAQVPFWAAVEAVSGDEEIGLHLCAFISPLAGEIMNSLFIYSVNVRAGIELFLRNLQLVSDHIFLQMTEDTASDQVRIAGCWGEKGVPRHTGVILAYITLKMLRLASGEKFQPLCLGFPFPSRGHAAEFESTFGCDVRFDQPEFFLCFHAGMLDIPLLHADPDLQRMQRVVAQRRMRQVLLQKVVEEVRLAITGQLGHGSPTLGLVAKQLGRSERTLRAELQDAGTNFNQVLSDTRKMLAKHMLATTTMSVEQVGHSVGFTERSAFYRAFRRWTGVTPLQYRARKQGSKEEK
jgi:AraC-like DNA-binding protein